MAKKNRRAKKDSYLNKRGKKNKRFLIFSFIILLLAGVGFFLVNSMLDRDIERLDKDIISSKKKLEEVNKEIEDLKKDYEMRNTDEFKEKLAEEELGMVKKDEKSDSDSKEDGQEENKASDKKEADKADEGQPENIEKDPREGAEDGNKG